MIAKKKALDTGIIRIKGRGLQGEGVQQEGISALATAGHQFGFGIAEAAEDVSRLRRGNADLLHDPRQNGIVDAIHHPQLAGAAQLRLQGQKYCQGKFVFQPQSEVAFGLRIDGLGDLRGIGAERGQRLGQRVVIAAATEPVANGRPQFFSAAPLISLAKPS